MSKSSIFENKALQQPAGFNLVSETNSFNSFFEPRPLDEKDDKAIQIILHENSLPENADRVQRDYLDLKALTSEIRAIGRVGTLLTGERVSKAREILIKYKEGAFTEWLNATFGSRKSGYNALAYFELHKSLQIDLKDKFKKMPLKAAYVLASRDADLSKKQDIVREYHDYDDQSLIALIQEKIPTSSPLAIKKTLIEKMISDLSSIVKRLEKEKSSLTEGNLLALSHVKTSIENLNS
jgi:hypothetical protein